MEEKKMIKINIGTVIYLMMIVILIVALVGVYYLGVIQKQEKIEKLEDDKTTLSKEIEKIKSNEEVKPIVIDKTEEKSNNQEEIPMEDLVTLNYEASDKEIRLFYGYIDEGNLYYHISKAVADGNVVGEVDFDEHLCKGNEIRKYEQLSNIKRMKEFSGGPSIRRDIFLITEEGLVYMVDIYNQDIIVELYTPLKDYKVEDILRYNTEEDLYMQILLKDGTTKIIQEN